MKLFAFKLHPDAVVKNTLARPHSSGVISMASTDRWGLLKPRFLELLWRAGCLETVPQESRQPFLTVVTHSFSFLFFSFLGLHLWHMEVPRLGVKSELHLPAYTTATATRDPNSRQCWILNLLSKARDWTRILKDTSWICYCWATSGTSGHPFRMCSLWYSSQSTQVFPIGTQ